MKYGSWSKSITDNSGVLYNSTHSFINDFKNSDSFDYVWEFSDNNVLFGETTILTSEPQYSAIIDDELLYAKTDTNQKVPFTVFNYGEITNDYTVNSYHSSDSSIFTVDENGLLTFVSNGTATLTITINENIVIKSTIIVKPDYYLITTIEEFRTLISADPSYNFKLGNIIDFKGEYITGSSTAFLVDNFSGIFDGQGYAILNAKLPGSWAGYGLIRNLSGTFKNVAFINLIGSSLCPNTAIVADNKGLIENVYVDFVINLDGREYGFAGVIAGFAGVGEMRNCITNLRLIDTLKVAPTFYGSIFGRASNWLASVNNCYSIVHDTGVIEIGAQEAANGIIDQFKNQGSRQFQTYTQLRNDADVSMYDSEIWSFENDKIVFGENVVYELQDDDLYTYIKTADQFVTEINENTAGKYRIANDIDFSGSEITFATNDIVFSGVIEGMGHILFNAVMNQNNIFALNSGEIRNLGFVDLHGPLNGNRSGLVKENTGIIDNVFVDFIINYDNTTYDYESIIAADASTGTISSTIVNIKLAEEINTAPLFYGSLVGKITSNSIITNSYAIVGSTNIKDVVIVEAEEGLIDELKSKTCNQYPNYSSITASGENYSTFNSY